MNIRILARVVTYDHEENKILLVKNKDTNFWHAQEADGNKTKKIF